MARASRKPGQAETLRYVEASRKNIPTAEYQALMKKDDESSITVAYERRNRDLDPHLVWRAKDERNWSDLVVQAPPLFVQEKMHPKVLINDLLRETKQAHPVDAREHNQEPVALWIDMAQGLGDPVTEPLRSTASPRPGAEARRDRGMELDSSSMSFAVTTSR